MLVFGVLLEVLLDVMATSAHGITSVQHLNDDITAVDHLVEFGPDAFALTLLEETGTNQLTAVLLTFQVLVLVLRVGLLCLGRLRGHRIQVIGLEIGTLTLGLGAESILEGGRGDGVRGGERTADVRCVGQQTPGQFVLAQDDTVGVLMSGAQLLAKVLQLSLAHGAGVAEPASVRLDASAVTGVLTHVLAAHHVALGVAHRSLLVHEQTLDGGRISVVARLAARRFAVLPLGQHTVRVQRTIAAAQTQSVVTLLRSARLAQLAFVAVAHLLLL
mmetsp:Transcript_3684/g.8921  ORF Transcript_3684/g.8921 Transcript_3684/m.8921 type:complete len:274 (+) Transcript_3684:1254-2075(+)